MAFLVRKRTTTRTRSEIPTTIEIPYTGVKYHNMHPLESFFTRTRDTPYGSPQWIWEIQLLSKKALTVILTGPGNHTQVWKSCFGYPGQPILGFVETWSREEALQELETNLLERFPELGPPPQCALARVLAGDLF
jgi:hypothetical protein